MENSPSWEANIFSGTQTCPHFVELESTYPCSLQPTICPNHESRYVLNVLLSYLCESILISSSHLRGGVQKSPVWHTKATPNGKCCNGYILTSPPMVKLMYQYQYVLKQRETTLKNSKVVLFLSPLKVGQAGNFWTHPCMCRFSMWSSSFSFPC